MMNLEDIFNRGNILDLSFFNFRNAITACYFADRDLRILKVNDNFRSFFPVLGEVSNAHFPNVLRQLGVDKEYINSFASQLAQKGRVLIPAIPLTIDGHDRMFSLLSTHTNDPTFSYLNGVQGQFVDRTEEWNLRMERERLMEERLRDRELIEEKTRQLERIANRLAKYLSPQIYGSIFSGKSETTDPLARKNLTIFFSDIEGFTEISDGMEPERLSFFINTYLSEMANIAIEYGGTIDKFIGDAVLIFFGDPETEGDRNDALKCVRMALRMRERVRELEKVWHENGISKPLKVRMGINTGYCTVGNFGSEHRIEYTVLGSPVNLAARLQTAAEADTILISESTYLLIENVAECRRMDDMHLKGFARPIGCYRLNAMRGPDGEEGPMTRVGRHVAVNIPDRRRIREAIEELRHIEQELEHHIAKE
ncbi:MAG: adenylate/guanylate cyclase domain-containing protein [Bauldia sp.]